ncbi:hypothetical protein JM18_000894 [Phytophthora kernoviae]|uniref:ATP-dependent RNA helicase n=2 Tax=Phytophthora kernoviae TaxID=325452 RepID=A0A8T0M881_9STRA|nr:hypothetical protein G195_001638 [Phytophthora kernoviae 00238/432]KAG2530745.1 hypothetical protein JM16_001464 [Phytophthora kernoviae]KAG2532920.1 hypothetical protein JM18_000894 [Phytophthora kernoviae]
MAPQDNSNSNSNNWRRKQAGGPRSEKVEGEQKKKRARRGGRRNNTNKNTEVSNGEAPAKEEETFSPLSDPVVADTPTTATNLDYLSDVLFSSLDISDKTKRAIVEDLKYERLTNVQNETFSFIREGKDVLAKAKTGNGKTIAFLLPVIENMVEKGRRKGVIPTLVISPTRELAQQIATEAQRLTKFHDVKVACFVGGANIKKDANILSSPTPVDILIATPGRLVDHLKSNTGSIANRLGQSSVLILDEADRLLDMGFRPDIMRIMGYLPRERQTLLFSATLPASTEELKSVALRSDYAFVDTIDENEADTNVQTEQKYVVVEMEGIVPMVERVLVEHMKLPAYKVMLFLPTARSAQFMAQLFQAAGFPGVLEMHSRKSQAMRTKTADAFRKGKKVVMFSSDVSARGVDYPDVSLVLQVGLTDRDQYIHRLGRTARAGMKGKGVLILAEFEAPMLNTLSDLPLEASKNHSPKDLVPSESRALKVIESLHKHSELEKSAQQSYQAWLGFYNSHTKRLKIKSEVLVQLAADSLSNLVTMDEMASMLESYAGGLQQSFASVFERVGQSLSQSAQMMQMMNDVMEVALLQNLIVSSTYASNGDDPQLLISVENLSQIQLVQVTVNVKLRDAETSFFSTTLESFGVGERHELRAPLRDAVAPVCGVIELTFASPGTHQPLSKRYAFRVLFFQQGVFEVVRGEGDNAASEMSAKSETVALERVRDLLQLSPLDGVMTDDVGRYRFVQYEQQNNDAVFYLTVKRGAAANAFQVVVSAAGSSDTDKRRTRCEQIIQELEDLAEGNALDDAPMRESERQQDDRGDMEQ